MALSEEELKIIWKKLENEIDVTPLPPHVDKLLRQSSSDESTYRKMKVVYLVGMVVERINGFYRNEIVVVHSVN